MPGVTTPKAQLQEAKFEASIKGGPAGARLTVQVTTEQLAEFFGNGATNNTIGGFKSVIYLTKAEAIEAGRPDVATLDQIDPLTVTTGTQAYVDLPSDGNRWLVARYDGKPEPDFKGYYDGNGRRYYDLASDGLAHLQWVPAEAGAPVPSLPNLLSGAELFAKVKAGPGMSITLENDVVVFTSTAAAPARPAAPTNAQVDDDANTFSVQAVPTYTAYVEYVFFSPQTRGVVTPLTAEYGYQSGNRIALKGITGEVAEDAVGIAVAASGNRPQGLFATNKKRFTGPAAENGTIEIIDVQGDDTLTITAVTAS